MALGTYPVKINGIEHQLQYDDQEAERLGLDATVVNDPAVEALEQAAAAKEAADAAAAEADAKAKADADAKAAEAPANKAGRPASK